MQKKVDISRAIDIPGWMSKVELTWLAERAQEYQSILEVGCFLGRSTAALAANTTGRVISVDSWDKDWYKSLELVDPKAYTLAHQYYSPFYTFMHKMGDYIVDRKIYPVRLRFDEFLPNFKCDMIFLDGDHSYEGLMRDIRHAMKLRPKLLCGHDYGGIWPDVKRVVDKCFTDKKIDTVESIWIKKF